jgi:hypothetical protein
MIRGLGQLLNAHMGCDHKTEYIVKDGRLTGKHGSVSFSMPFIERAGSSEATTGSAIFHAIANVLLESLTESHDARKSLVVNDEEYAAIV